MVKEKVAIFIHFDSLIYFINNPFLWNELFSARREIRASWKRGRSMVLLLQCEICKHRHCLVRGRKAESTCLGGWEEAAFLIHPEHTGHDRLLLAQARVWRVQRSVGALAHSSSPRVRKPKVSVGPLFLAITWKLENDSLLSSNRAALPSGWPQTSTDLLHNYPCNQW